MATNHYYSNKPITSAKNDLYNRVGFANDIVRALSSFGDDESYIIGIYAKWGFGKTSVINLINEKLNDDERFVSIVIDAWSLGGVSEKILQQILKDIYEKLTGKDVGTRVSRWGKKLKKFSSAQIPFDLDFEFDINSDGRKETKISSGRIINSINFAAKLMESSNNIAIAKEKVGKAIQDKKKKIVIFIDNIDRLEKTQILATFRLLSTIADYAGITYVLLFDKDYVCSAIEENLPQGCSGAEYVEKIVQIPIHLPMPPRSNLDEVFTTLLMNLLEEYSIKLSKKEIERFQSLYFSYGINGYLQSPRNINQMVNALRFALPIKLGEVNVVDLIMIEIIRVFDEPFYKKIRDNGYMLLQNNRSLSDGYMFDDRYKERKADIEKTFDIAHLEVIKQLFPFVGEIYNSTDAEGYNSLRMEQRLGSEYYFDRFFGPLVEARSISDQKVLHLLNNSKDKRTIDKNLKIINMQNIDVALRVISDRCDLIKNKLAFCESLLDLIDDKKLLQCRSVALTISVFDRALFTMDTILKGSGDKLADYSALLKYSFTKNRIDIIPYLIRQVVVYSDPNRAHGKVILNQEDLAQYRGLALDIIRKLAKDDKIPINTIEDYAFTYSYWASFGGKGEISKYIKKHIKTADAAIDFMSQFLGKWSNMGDDVYYRSDFNEETYQKICGYIDPEYFYTLIMKDEKYSQYKGVAEDAIVSFEDLLDEDSKTLAKIGNEHTEDFRKVIAQRFIHIFEHTIREGELNEDSELPLNKK